MWVLNDAWLALGIGIGLVVRETTSFDASKETNGVVSKLLATEGSLSVAVRFAPGEVMPGMFVDLVVVCLCGSVRQVKN